MDRNQLDALKGILEIYESLEKKKKEQHSLSKTNSIEDYKDENMEIIEAMKKVIRKYEEE